jgi:phosphoglycolate phosphatase-like HAD superfamily hydrolase
MSVAIFDFDGTLSLIRSGWMPLMVAQFMEELIPLAKSQSEKALRTEVENVIFDLTGKETIFQMKALCEAVRRRGGEPQSADEYKQIFLKNLLQLVQTRLGDLRNGLASADQYLVPGARTLLDSLIEKGMTLYLASGTDHENVLEEAEALNIARYFGDRIYGARTDGQGYTKAALVRYLLEDARYKPAELVAFGDGVVEIKEVSKVAGMTVGLATDEPECSKVEPGKRAHLIAAGANIIVPNYLDPSALLGLIFPQQAVIV